MNETNFVLRAEVETSVQFDNKTYKEDEDIDEIFFDTKRSQILPDTKKSQIFLDTNTLILQSRDYWDSHSNLMSKRMIVIYSMIRSSSSG